MTGKPLSLRNGHVRVSDRDRDEALELLARAATDGRLTFDEYGERADRALAARTRDELASTTHDLEPTLAVAEPGRHDARRVEQIIAIVGRETRQGGWPVSPQVRSWAVFGACTIDLQHVTWGAWPTVIDARAVFGSIQILVPDGVDVRLTGRSLFGSRSCNAREAPLGSPVVEIRGYAVFGDVTVRRPRLRDGVRRIIDARLHRQRL